MSTYSVYDQTTGLLTGQVIQCRNAYRVLENLPEGFYVVEGQYDRANWRVDLETRQPVQRGADDPPADNQLTTWAWEGGKWVARPSPYLKGLAARQERARLFNATEWVRSRAQDRNEEVSQAWLDYWQALRDVPEQEGFPQEIQWPEPPAT